MALWSAKGGSGLSVVAAGLAALSARSRPTVLVDLAGDQPAICGLASEPQLGVADWLHEAVGAPAGGPERLRRLGHAVAPGLTLLPVGAGGGALGTEHDTSSPSAAEAALALGEALDALPDPVVVDAGTAHGAAAGAVVERSDPAVLVTRPCYLALRRAVGRGEMLAGTRGIVVVEEKHRVLDVDDVARVLGLPVLAVVPAHADIGRAADAGTLVTRPPRRLTRPIASLVPAPGEPGPRPRERSA